MKKVHKTATDHGWGAVVPQDNPAIFAEKMLLVISEISEALEAFRSSHPLDRIWYNGNKPEGIPIELADAVIRILDFCEANEIDLEYALKVKMDYNDTRSYRHGNKVM